MKYYSVPDRFSLQIDEAKAKMNSHLYEAFYQERKLLHKKVFNFLRPCYPHFKQQKLLVGKKIWHFVKNFPKNVDRRLSTLIFINSCTHLSNEDYFVFKFCFIKYSCWPPNIPQKQHFIKIECNSLMTKPECPDALRPFGEQIFIRSERKNIIFRSKYDSCTLCQLTSKNGTNFMTKRRYLFLCTRTWYNYEFFSRVLAIF